MHNTKVKDVYTMLGCQIDITNNNEVIVYNPILEMTFNKGLKPSLILETLTMMFDIDKETSKKILSTLESVSNITDITDTKQIGNV